MNTKQKFGEKLASLVYKTKEQAEGVLNYDVL